MSMALQQYFEEIGYQVAGRKIEIIMEDDESNPATALTKSRKLVERDGVHIMSGGMSAAVGYALAPYIDSKGIPMTYPLMAPDDLTQRKIFKWIVRTGWRAVNPITPRRVCLQCPQIPEGHSDGDGFRFRLGIHRRFPESL